MDIFLVRHGPAEGRDPRRWPSDDDRPLSRIGVPETEEAARGFARIANGAVRVVSSPAVRAYSTAVIFQQALKLSGNVGRWPELAPESPADPVLARVADEGRAANGLVLVSHEPVLSELIGLALTGEAVSLVHMARAGAAAIRFDASLRPGAGRLEWLMPRRALARAGR
ncbi:MAG TPA: histidine phosphatase family protein [Thermoplasmata archaeon]|nr:histidine phosphatase family protein [Thermoplasmata archaeon]